MEILSGWLEKKYLDWQVNQGRRSTLDEFAEYLGFTRAYISMIMNGSRKNLTMSSAYQIGEQLYDYSILEILGYPVPDASLAGWTLSERIVIKAFLESVKVAVNGLPDGEREAKLKEILGAMPGSEKQVN